MDPKSKYSIPLSLVWNVSEGLITKSSSSESSLTITVKLLWPKPIEQYSSMRSTEHTTKPGYHIIQEIWSLIHSTQTFVSRHRPIKFTEYHFRKASLWLLSTPTALLTACISIKSWMYCFAAVINCKYGTSVKDKECAKWNLQQQSVR